MDYRRAEKSSIFCVFTENTGELATIGSEVPQDILKKFTEIP